MRFLLDSDICIGILRSSSTFLDAISAVIGAHPVCISVITVAEIFKNSHPHEEKMNRLFFSCHPQLPVDSKIAMQAGRYWKLHRDLNLNMMDYLIAGTCKIHKLTLVTRNTKHFPMRDIKVIDPLKSHNLGS